VFFKKHQVYDTPKGMVKLVV